MLHFHRWKEVKRFHTHLVTNSTGEHLGWRVAAVGYECRCGARKAKVVDDRGGPNPVADAHEWAARRPSRARVLKLVK